LSREQMIKASSMGSWFSPSSSHHQLYILLWSPDCDCWFELQIYR